MKKLKRLLYSLTIVVALVFTLPPIQANAEDWTTYTVHVTRTGSKYHRAGCSYLKSDIPINILDAVNQGYTPCSRCNPPYPTVINKSTVQSAPTVNNQETYSQSPDIYNYPVQDTVYRGYYAAYTAEYNRRLNNYEFDDNLFQNAMNDKSYTEMSVDESIYYYTLSDMDRFDYQVYKLLSVYDNYVYYLNQWSPVFDPVYYYNTYPDVANSIGFNKIGLLLHFMSNGVKEGRQGCATFNVYSYMANNPDLVQLFGSDISVYYTDYITYGQYLGRKVF